MLNKRNKKHKRTPFSVLSLPLRNTSKGYQLFFSNSTKQGAQGKKYPSRLRGTSTKRRKNRSYFYINFPIPK